MRWVKFLVVAMMGWLVVSAIQQPAQADKYEQPAYRVERKEGAIEIRQYPAQLAAEVTTTGEREEAINQGFRLLADFIFGNNTTRDKIAMTAPVTQQKPADPAKPGARIAMTAPVTQQASTRKDNSWTIRFYMPTEYTLATLPKPNNDRIRITETAPQRMAVIRFAGTSSERNLETHQRELAQFVVDENLAITGEPTYAFYNPPFTLPMLRRNEIMVTLSQ